MSVRKTNKDRTDAIASLMLVFLQRYGYQQSEAQEDDYYIRDLLCDLKHFCDEYAIDFENQLRIAEIFYDEDIREEVANGNTKQMLKEWCETYEEAIETLII